MTFIYSSLIVIGILLLAYWIRKATKGTPFDSSCPCTPRIKQLKHMEDPDCKTKKENLW